MIAYYILFHYMPMYGATIAFRDFSPMRGFFESPWVGMKHFRNFFQDVYFTRILRNTLSISALNLLFGFPAPILLALMINEVRSTLFKRTVQTICYLPHFISLMVICGMILDFTASDGVINDIIAFFGGKRATMLINPGRFRPVYIISEIWQTVGWGSIIYLAALSGIDSQLYEAARIDGAGRFRQTLHITLPGILPTVIVILIIRVGQVMNLGFEKIILLYTPATYETADVISSYVYRKGLQDFNYSFSAAVGLFNSLINLVLLSGTNYLSKRATDNSLW